jgi:hypothetical protein
MQEERDMATARHLLNNPIEVTISPTGTVSSAQQNLVLSSGSVQFQNDATFDVKLVFTAEFGTVTVDAGDPSDDLSATNVTVNYVIQNKNNGQQTGGPYSIQFGIGPLAISISGTSPTPDNAIIPVGGKIQFTTNMDDMIEWTYAVGGGSANSVFTPALTELDSGTNPVQTAPVGTSTTLNYSLNSAIGAAGKGTIKIGN